MDSKTIEEQAAAWLVRREGSDWTEADAAQLAAWLDASTANRVAFLRLEVGWEQSERLTALGAGKPAGTVPARGQWHVSPFFEARQPTNADSKHRYRKRPLVGLVASLLISVAIGAYFLLIQAGDDYATPIGGTSSIPLHDGSNVMLNTATKIRVAVTNDERRIELDQGEAYFEVAKDPSRPFVVVVGDQRVIAVGTQFSVLRDEGEIRVVVTEGKVRLESARTSHDKQNPAAPLLVAGSIAHVSNAAVVVEQRPPQRAEEILSWRTGYLIFDETTLADAVAEFNRYNTRQIYIQDPEVAALRINGKFRFTNAEAFIRVLRDGFGIQAHESDGRTVLAAR